MSEEFNIFKNLDDLRKTNLLDQIKCLASAQNVCDNDSQGLDNDDFDIDAILSNNNVKKSPIKRQPHKEKISTPEKKSKRKTKSRTSSMSTDGSISPILPLLENLSKKVDDVSVSRRTRRSLGALEKIAQPTIVLENIDPSPSTNRGRGKKRASGRGRGRGRRSTTNTEHGPNHSINADTSFDISMNTTSCEISPEISTLTVMERFLQQGRRGRSRVMRARRQYVPELAARSTQVDFIDLVSSPLPRVEGFIDLDLEPEKTTRITRSKKKGEKFSINSGVSKSKKDFDISIDEDNPELNIKVKWNGKSEAFKLRKYQKFSLIFQKLAERDNIDEKSIVFNINDRIIMPDDTPESINYQIFQFIDGRILSNQFISPTSVAAASQRRDNNKINLKIQSDKWKRSLQIDLNKTDKFRILYIKCAEELNVGLEQLKLSFDGELLELNDTPIDLDLEGGEVIDLRIKN